MLLIIVLFSRKKVIKFIPWLHLKRHTNSDWLAFKCQKSFRFWFFFPLKRLRIAGQTTEQPYLSPSTVNPGPNSPSTPALTSAPPSAASLPPRRGIGRAGLRGRGRRQRRRRRRKRPKPRVLYARLRLVMRRQEFQKFYRSSIRASHRSRQVDRRIGNNRRQRKSRYGLRRRNFSQ